MTRTEEVLERKRRQARLSAKRHLWAYQDAQRSKYEPAHRPTYERSRLTAKHKDDLTTIGLITLVVLIMVLAASN